MSSEDPKLICAPERKAEIEAENGVERLDYIANLVNDRKITKIRESRLQDLKAIAIQGIYPCGTSYRNANMHVRLGGSKHQLPHESRVPSLVVDRLGFVNAEGDGAGRSALERVAYALWRLNWIHAFAGGNGRTARAPAYLILCIENGATLPAVPTMPLLIAKRRDEYIACLVAADDADEAGKMDISKMTMFLREVLTQQLESAVSKFGLKIGPA
jgi:Fic family protein